jgi:hypothetical protein
MRAPMTTPSSASLSAFVTIGGIAIASPGPMSDDGHFAKSSGSFGS